MRATKGELPVLLEAGDASVRGADWGYVLKGQLRVETDGQEEVLRAGDYYYMAAGHLAFADEDTEFLEVAPSDIHEQAMEAVRRNAGVA